eukprot:COSAG05_NODE_484_length_9355_cov_5.704840_1_plen_61_part_00
MPKLSASTGKSAGQEYKYRYEYPAVLDVLARSIYSTGTGTAVAKATAAPVGTHPTGTRPS